MNDVWKNFATEEQAAHYYAIMIGSKEFDQKAVDQLLQNKFSQSSFLNIKFLAAEKMKNYEVWKNFATEEEAAQHYAKVFGNKEFDQKAVDQLLQNKFGLSGLLNIKILAAKKNKTAKEKLFISIDSALASENNSCAIMLPKEEEIDPSARLLVESMKKKLGEKVKFYCSASNESKIYNSETFF